MAAKKQQESFEELYRRLEETVARLEQGGLPLEESLALYEEGMALARRCQALLDAAELKITRLREAVVEAGAPERPPPAESEEAEPQ